jgi:hypothetical protein
MSQVGEGLYAYDTSVNSVFDFGGREQCAGTLFAQGIGPMPESDYPCRGANGTLASDDFVANKDAYLQQRIAFYKSTYWWADDDTLRSMAESDYNRYVGLYQKFDAYSPFDDWSITEPDEVGSGRLKGSAYTLTDNNVFNYWARIDSDEELAEEEHFRKQPLYRSVSYALWQDSIDQIKSELYEGHGVSVGVTISDDSLNTDTWSAYDSQFSAGASHVVCIVGWDDGYAASNFTHTTDREGATLWGDEEKAAQLTTPPGNGAWICKNSWGSETDAVAGGLMASDGTTKDAHAGDWGIVVQQVHVADDGVTLYGIEAQECDGYRTIRRDPVYGVPVVNEGESFFIIEGITDKEEGSTDGWLDVTAPFSKEMMLFFKPEIAENTSMLDFYVDRYCGKPIQSFFNIDNFCIKAFGEPASLEHVDAVAPTCKKAGTVEHWLDSETGVAYADENGTEPLKDTTVAPLGHAWGKATGTAGKSKRLEAMQVVLVEKGAKAPGKTYKGVTQTYAKPFV